MTLYRGDDTNAFNQKFLRIEIINKKGAKIKKAEFRCGEILKIYENPDSFIDVVLTAEETKKLKFTETCHLACYDELDRKWTCDEYYTIQTKGAVV